MTSAAERPETVWIPAVPLPLQGWRTDRCSCGQRFRGKDRRHAYELHYRRDHQRGDTAENEAQMEVTRAEARRIYAEVNADTVSDGEDRGEAVLMPDAARKPKRVVVFEPEGDQLVVAKACRVCRAAIDHARVVSPAGVAHHANDWGDTDCGKNATRDGWWWAW